MSPAPTDFVDPGNLIIKTEGQDFLIENPIKPELSTISGILNTLIGFLLPIGLIVVFIMIVYAGFTYISSDGDPARIKKAQGTIVTALIGLFLLFLAFFIVRLVGYIFNFQGGIL